MWLSIIVTAIIFALATRFLRTGKMPMSNGDWIRRAERPALYWTNIVIILIFGCAAAGMAVIAYLESADR